MRVRGYAPATPCWTVLSSADPGASADFYGGLFGWTTAAADDGTTTFLLRDLAVAGLAAAPGRPSAWLTYVSTEDIEATAGRVGDAERHRAAPADPGRHARAHLPVRRRHRRGLRRLAARHVRRHPGRQRVEHDLLERGRHP